MLEKSAGRNGEALRLGLADGQVVPLAVDTALPGLFILIGLTQVNGIFGNTASRKGIFFAPTNEPANARAQV